MVDKCLLHIFHFMYPQAVVWPRRIRHRFTNGVHADGLSRSVDAWFWRVPCENGALQRDLDRTSRMPCKFCVQCRLAAKRGVCVRRWSVVALVCPALLRRSSRGRYHLAKKSTGGCIFARASVPKRQYLINRLAKIASSLCINSVRQHKTFFILALANELFS